jgi:hypothetical protein
MVPINKDIKIDIIKRMIRIKIKERKGDKNVHYSDIFVWYESRFMGI